MINYDVVIIDSGVALNTGDNVCGICIKRTCEGFEYSKDLSDEIGHGTIIYSIIKRRVDPSRIFIIKLAESTDESNVDCLIAALEYVKENISCKIVNISLGIKTSDELSELYNACAAISKKGTVIIAAFDNEGCHSYPAAFDCVIGVDTKNDFRDISEFDFVENSPINVLAKGNVQRLSIPGGKTLLVSGTSISCAHVTSILSKEITSELNLQKALSYLKTKARYIYSFKKTESVFGGDLFKINNAVVFPFAKEAHAFIRFADMLSFRIHRYYDVRHSGKVGRKLSSYYDGANSEDRIMDIDRIDLNGIDTLILGHLDELNHALKRDFKEELIKKAIEMRVNIYSFDPLDEYSTLLKTSDIKCFYPRITQNHVPHNSFGKLYKIPKPVVGIFGTSSQQGKFSLQLALKKCLELHGYDVGAIGTEPHSLLFDFDIVFPMGYNATVYLHNNEIVLYLNHAINSLCRNGKEIILGASQAQTIPYYCNNLLEFPPMQYHFALGLKPDAIVMCVNYHDEIGYIRNTVYTLMGLTDASIIAFVMYPIAYPSDWNGIYGNSKRYITDEEFDQKARLLQKEFSAPVYMLGEQQHIEDLCQKIIDFF